MGSEWLMVVLFWSHLIPLNLCSLVMRSIFIDFLDMDLQMVCKNTQVTFDYFFWDPVHLQP